MENLSRNNQNATPYCQIVKQYIEPNICLETQGQDGCYGCGAPTRLCEKCKIRLVAIPEKGLCDNCLVNLSDPTSKNNLQKRKGGNVMDSSEHNSICMKCGKSPIFIKKHGLCKECVYKIYAENKQKKGKVNKPNELLIDKFYEAAKALVIKHQSASEKLLRKYLRNNHIIAAQLLKRMEKDGIIGPYLGGGRKRAILIRSEVPLSEQEKPIALPRINSKYSSEEKITKLTSFISLIGRESELGNILQAIITDIRCLEKIKNFLQQE